MANDKEISKVMEMSQALLENRLGIAPIGSVFKLTNERVAEALEIFFENAGINIDNDNYAVKVLWNPRFSTDIREKKRKSDNYPFRVLFGVRLSKNERKKRMLDGGSVVNRVMNMVEQTAQDTNDKAQFHLQGSDSLNKALSPFVDEKIKFKGLGKGRYQVELDPELVLSYIFKLDSKTGSKYRWILDAVAGPDPKKLRGNNGAHFSFTVAKTFMQQSYKKVKNSDLLDGMR
jgi:hypothetical protein